MLVAVKQYLDARRIRITTGTILDATNIDARSSFKNSTGERDPEMLQTRKGRQRYFGLKTHIVVDSKPVASSPDFSYNLATCSHERVSCWSILLLLVVMNFVPKLL